MQIYLVTFAYLTRYVKAKLLDYIQPGISIKTFTLSKAWSLFLLWERLREWKTNVPA